MRGLALTLGLLAALALTAGPAGAKSNKKIVATVEDIGFEFPTAACEEGTITFSLVALDGRAIGTGASCIHKGVDCSFTSGCRGTAFVDFTLTFAQGTVSAPVEIDEVWLTDTSVAQRARGKISSGTGAFAGAKGSLKCDGDIEFADAGPIPDLTCVVHAS